MLAKEQLIAYSSMHMLRRVRDEVLAQRRFRELGLTLITVAVCIGVVIVPVEAGHGYFYTVEDGLWWAVTTITSVGYGDLVPVTTLGRIMGAILQLMGVASLGLIIGLISQLVMRRQEELFWNREFERFNQIEERLEIIEKHLQYLIRAEYDSQQEIENNAQEANQKRAHTKRS